MVVRYSGGGGGGGGAVLGFYSITIRYVGGGSIGVLQYYY